MSDVRRREFITLLGGDGYGVSARGAGVAARANAAGRRADGVFGERCRGGSRLRNSSYAGGAPCRAAKRNEFPSYRKLGSRDIVADRCEPRDPPPLKWSDLRYLDIKDELLPILGPACWPFASQFRSARAACR
jgi:hypothetical protein